jgi:hypothetical protein
VAITGVRVEKKLQIAKNPPKKRDEDTLSAFFSAVLGEKRDENDIGYSLENG